MKISVIIPVKNRAALLKKTIANILSQKLLPTQIIVVDDRSDEDIKAVVDTFSNSLLTYMVNREAGPGSGRNTGLSVATGDLIQFFDSDDLMTENKLAIQASQFNADTDFVYGPYVKAKETKEGWVQLDDIMQYFPLPTDKKLTDLVLEGWCPITQSVLFSAALLRKVGPWRVDLMPHEDYEYWFRIAKEARNYKHTNECCVIYRQHENQITDAAVSNRNRWLDGLNAMEIINKQIDFEPHWRSRMIFKGRQSKSYYGFEKAFGSNDLAEITPPSKAAYWFEILYNKLERMRTKSLWHRMQGVLRNSEGRFQEYTTTIKQ